MRVLHIINDAQVGGAQTLIEGLATERLDGDEVRLAVLLGPDTLSERYARAFDQVHYVRLVRRRPNVLRALRELQALVDSFEPDVVHSHLEQADLLAQLLRIRQAIRVSTIHTSGYSARDHLLTRWIARVVARRSRRFDAVIACDDSCLPFMRDMGYRSPGIVIRNGVMVPGNTSYRPESKVLLCLARWHPMKGFEYLFEAFDRFGAEHPDWSLVCAGSDMDDANAELVGLLAKMRPDVRARVALLGPVADIVPLIRQAGALVLASTYGEAFVLVGMEAAVHGLPVIITDIGGSREFVVDDAFLVEPASAPDLHRAFAQFAAASLERRMELSRLSRQIGVTRFSVAATAQEYDRVYRQAFAAKPVSVRGPHMAKPAHDGPDLQPDD